MVRGLRLCCEKEVAFIIYNLYIFSYAEAFTIFLLYSMTCAYPRTPLFLALFTLHHRLHLLYLTLSPLACPSRVSILYLSSSSCNPYLPSTTTFSPQGRGYANPAFFSCTSVLLPRLIILHSSFCYLSCTCTPS